MDMTVPSTGAGEKVYTNGVSAEAARGGVLATAACVCCGTKLTSHSRSVDAIDACRWCYRIVTLRYPHEEQFAVSTAAKAIAARGTTQFVIKLADGQFQLFTPLSVVPSMETRGLPEGAFIVEHHYRRVTEAARRDATLGRGAWTGD